MMAKMFIQPKVSHHLWLPLSLMAVVTSSTKQSTDLTFYWPHGCGFHGYGDGNSNGNFEENSVVSGVLSL